LQRLGLDALELALHGGEDYELLFTVPRKYTARLSDGQARLPRDLEGVPITAIGEITRAKQVRAVDENRESKLLRPGGWDPFRS
jgi:thiamine-monophosphate kinase